LKAYKKILLLLLIFLCCWYSDINAQDTLSVADNGSRINKADPLKATMLAVAFPGLGQIYNRKYWKVPLVYAGFGGVIYSIHYNTSNYNTYLKAYQDFTDKIPETASYLDLIKNADPATYDPVLYPDSYNPSNEEWYKERMLRGVDYYKKYRDLSYIGIAAWFLITVLDANVDASLSGFDVSDNLGLNIIPLSMPLYGQSLPVLNLSMKYKF
jgi:hypothetical protein